MNAKWCRITIPSNTASGAIIGVAVLRGWLARHSNVLVSGDRGNGTSGQPPGAMAA
jgi:hypothetical protein